MKRLTLMIFFFFAFGFAFGQTELALIVGTEDEIKIYKEKDSLSSDVAVKQKGGFLFCRVDTYGWWQVRDFYANTGYVRKENLSLVKNIPAKQKQKIIFDAIEKCGANIALSDSLKLVANDEQSRLHLKETERFQDEVYNPVLHFFPVFFSETMDTKLLSSFLKLLTNSQMHSNELSVLALGDCYICNPKLVLQKIKAFPEKEENTLMKILQMGFENINWNRDLDNGNYDKLKAMLSN